MYFCKYTHKQELDLILFIIISCDKIFYELKNIFYLTIKYSIFIFFYSNHKNHLWYPIYFRCSKEYVHSSASIFIFPNKARNTTKTRRPESMCRSCISMSNNNGEIHDWHNIVSDRIVRRKELHDTGQTIDPV